VQRLERVERRFDVGVAARRAARLGATIDLERRRIAKQPGDIDLDRIDHTRLGARRLVGGRDDLDRAGAALQHDTLVGIRAAEADELVLDVEFPNPLFDRGHGLVRALVAVAPLGDMFGLGFFFTNNFLDEFASFFRLQKN
jgi:hypothetical protein